MVTEETAPCPVNVYGRTKAEAERAVQEAHPGALIIRTNFYGWGSPLKASLSDWLLAGLARGLRRPTFADVWFTPILINDLLEVVLALADRGARGIYHVAGADRVTKHAFAVALAETFGYPNRLLVPVQLADRPRAARRPRDLSLSVDKTTAALDRPLPGLREGLGRLLALRQAGWPARLAQAVTIEAPVRQRVKADVRA
jgi:dTDP-4-dehydrorhamnose reductase